MNGRRSPVMTSAWCLRLAAASGFLVVALGAFGAHSLKPLLQTHQTLEIWGEAFMYDDLDTLVLLSLAAQPGIAMGVVVSFLCGIVLFSGSLYVMALTNLRWLGAVTPLGGVSFLVGWAWLLVIAGSRSQG